MTDAMRIEANKKNYAMSILFSIEKNQQKILEGSFLVTPTQGISCVGENHIVEYGFKKEELYKTGIFKGLIITHILEEESASLSFTLLDVEQDPSSPLGVKQVVVFQTGMNMGVLSGSKAQDSIMISPEHVFRYRTILFQQKKG